MTHRSELRIRRDFFALLSNFYCLPGRAGGLPADASVVLIIAHPIVLDQDWRRAFGCPIPVLARLSRSGSVGDRIICKYIGSGLHNRIKMFSQRIGGVTGTVRKFLQVGNQMA